MTIPVDKEKYLSTFEPFAQQTNRLVEQIQTKDGFVFSFEFESIEEQTEFKKKTEALFPNIYR